MNEVIISRKFIALLVVIIAVLSSAGNFTYFSSIHTWFDQALHFLGGGWIAAVFLNVFNSRPHIFDIRKGLAPTLFFASGAAALVGVSWEFFEYIVFLVDPASLTLADTLQDLFLDLSGALVFVLLWWSKRARVNL